MQATQPAMTLDDILARSDHVIAQHLGGEAVLVDLSGEKYFGLNEVGVRIWDLLDGKATLGDAHRTLCAEFDADAERIRVDLLALAESLTEAGLAVTVAQDR